jgi:hypothetical protein
MCSNLLTKPETHVRAVILKTYEMVLWLITNEDGLTILSISAQGADFLVLYRIGGKLDE